MLSGLALEQSELLWDYYDVLGSAAVVISVLILLFALDDLFVDACYWIRRTKGRPIELSLEPEALLEVPERPLAIMVPAWAEHDVIRRMLQRVVETLDYHRYVIFVGTYPNDFETIAEVERARSGNDRVVRVQVPNPGPTCKADCLNAIVRALFAHEKFSSETFAGAVLHDSEDVLHPLELKLFNRMLHEADLIQLPVVALERRWWDFVSGTYMDEFAEWHTKDLVVREMLAGGVPSAGVGTCFSGRALRHLAQCKPDEPFNTATLTEDYDISERLARVGMRSRIVIWPIPQLVSRAGFRRKSRSITALLPLCVREFFPNSVSTSSRQKARWTIGIALQGWEQLGWSDRLSVNYFLFRDRKVLITPFVGVAALFLILNVLFLLVAASLGAWDGPLPDIFAPTGWFGLILALNLLALCLRLGQRAWFVSRLYGWENGLMSVPRVIVGTLINALATARAVRLYLVSQWFGTKLAWDKTMHEFPTGGELALQTTGVPAGTDLDPVTREPAAREN